ncbi:MAG TPA: hypothetical protein VIU93_00745 [Gallionellaceae bacterium]
MKRIAVMLLGVLLGVVDAQAGAERSIESAIIDQQTSGSRADRLAGLSSGVLVEPGVLEGEFQFRLEEGGCKIFFTARAKHRMPSANVQEEQELSLLQEYCGDAVSSGEETELLKAIFNKVFEHPVFFQDRYIWIGRMAAMPFDCDLIRYAARSAEWEELSKKLGKKPRFYKEQLPNQELAREVGEFIRKAGLLQNIEAVFSERGYHTKIVGVGGFATKSVNKLNARERGCAGNRPVTNILPVEAETFIVFERSVNERTQP